MDGNSFELKLLGRHRAGQILGEADHVSADVVVMLHRFFLFAWVCLFAFDLEVCLKLCRKSRAN